MENDKLSPLSLIKAKEGYTLLYRGIFLYDQFNPVSKISQKIKNIHIKPDTLIIIPSPLLFYGVRDLHKQLPPRCYVLCIECDNNLYNLKDHPESQYSHDIKYIYASSPDYFINFIDTIKMPFRNIVFLPINRGYLLYKDFYLNCHDTINKSLKHFLKNTLTLYSLGQRYYINIFQNMPSHAKHFDIKDLVVTAPVIVAGAGESLEESIPFLKKYRSYFKILALDTSLRTLTDSGIVPDFIIAVESQIYNISDFHDNAFSKIPLIADMTSYPLTSRLFKGDIYYFTSGFSNSRFLDKCVITGLIPSIIPPLGSVGITAVYIALKISCFPVFYTGIDFSFTPGKTHAKNCPALLSSLINLTRLSGDKNYYQSFTRDLIQIKNMRGGNVYTTSTLNSYAGTFSEILNNNNRVYSLFSCGIVYNINNVNDENSFKDLLVSASQEVSAQASTKNPDDLTTLSNKMVSFLETQLEIINSIITSGINSLNGRNESENNAIIKRLIHESDYLIPQYPFISDNENVIDNVKIKYILLYCFRFKKTIEKTIRIILHLS